MLASPPAVQYGERRLQGLRVRKSVAVAIGRKAMRTEPMYRVYSRWPEDGDAWIHPADVRLVRRLIPSARVFRCEGREGKFLVLAYGKYRVRVLPALREAIPGDGFDLGDQVEVCSRMGKNRPFVATISEMHWNAHHRVIQYRLRRRNMTLARPYTAEDFRAVVHHGRPPSRFTPPVQVALE